MVNRTRVGIVKNTRLYNNGSNKLDYGGMGMDDKDADIVYMALSCDEICLNMRIVA